MTHDQLYAELRVIAPSVAFSAHAELDPFYVWDGDGDEPEDMDAHDVVVSAEAVYGGRLVKGTAYLGGHYLSYGEQPGDVSGYLPQLLQDAADELKGEVSDPEVLAQLKAVDEFLRREMRARYDAERSALAFAEMDTAGDE